jgi:cellulose synthase/poly-beta-1,6-N-acetylglucosamine synthase-like glycosyltransferase
MLYIITPCSRPENLNIIYRSIPSEATWIISHDQEMQIPNHSNIVSMKCPDNGKVGTKARNYVLNNFPFNNEDYILFHDDDNIIHPDLYSNIVKYFDLDFSLMCWGQLNKDNSIRLHPTLNIVVGQIDTASFLIKWEPNKHVRHRIDIYEHDGIYAHECSKNGNIVLIKKYLSYYNYLR